MSKRALAIANGSAISQTSTPTKETPMITTRQVRISTEPTFAPNGSIKTSLGFNSGATMTLGTLFLNWMRSVMYAATAHPMNGMRVQAENAR